MFRLPQRKTIWIIGGVLAALLLGGAVFGAGWFAGSHYPQKLVVEGVSHLNPDGGQIADFSGFWQVWKLINDNHLKSPDISAAAKVSGAIKGLVGSLQDPYSQFFTASEARKFQEDVRGNFGGIGAELSVRKEQVVVVAPLKNTPATRIGLKAGDRIVKINSSSTQGVALDEAVSWIRGVIGTDVKLTIMRDDWTKPKELTVTRDVIQVPTLDFSMKDDIAYVQLYSFNSNTDSLFAQAVSEAKQKGARGMILDLRDDPGGYLDVAVDIAGWFLPPNSLVVSEASRVQPKQDLHTSGPAYLVDLPVVVIINQGSASASEILAGALRDNRKVKLVGQTSFGKGTVQQIFPVLNSASLKLTIAHWVLPSGHILENGGLKPDMEVKITDEDVAKKRDPQLEKALEIVRKLITNNV